MKVRKSILVVLAMAVFMIAAAAVSVSAAPVVEAHKGDTFSYTIPNSQLGTGEEVGNVKDITADDPTKLEYLGAEEQGGSVILNFKGLAEGETTFTFYRKPNENPGYLKNTKTANILPAIPKVYIGNTLLVDGKEYSATDLPGVILKGTVKLSGTTLYLNGAELTATTDYTIESDWDGLTIVLTGENIVENSVDWAIRGINVTFTGDGSLKVTGDANIIDVYQTLTFDSANVEAGYIGAYSTYDTATKTLYKGIINFKGTSKVSVTTDNRSSAIYADDDIFFNLTAGGKVYAKATDAAIRVGSINTITFADNNVVTLPTKGKVVDCEGILYIADADGKNAKEAVIEYVAPQVAPEEVKKGVPTADTNDLALWIALFAIATVCGGAVALKKN